MLSVNQNQQNIKIENLGLTKVVIIRTDKDALLRTKVADRHRETIQTMIKKSNTFQSNLWRAEKKIKKIDVEDLCIRRHPILSKELTFLSLETQNGDDLLFAFGVCSVNSSGKS